MFANLLRVPRIRNSLVVFASHTSTCPSSKKMTPQFKGTTIDGGGNGSKSSSMSPLTRAEFSAKCRMGFIPEEWFLFMHSKTGVSGPYILGLVFTNYLVSKEIFVMEHEYYTGLSWLVIVYYVYTKMGTEMAASLDKQVDDVVAEYEKGRKEDVEYFNDVIKESKEAQWRAEGQKLLIEAKKENVALQLEAEYRERSMMVYRTVKGRMDYHVKRYYAEARIHQKWMIEWILNSVMHSITADFEQKALDQAIMNLGTVAIRT